MSILKEDCSLINYKGSAEYNEDIVGMNSHGVWVLDGATGLNGKKLVSNTTDAHWYVNWWNEYLSHNIANKSSLKEIMTLGIDQVNKEYQKRLQVDIKINKLDLPSSSIVVLKFYENKLEYLILGDCVLFSEKEIIRDQRLCHLDDLVYDKMIKLINEEHKNFQEARALVQDLVVTNRLKNNTEDGYWILGFEREAIKNALHGYLIIDDEQSILLASDGYTCACDRYGLFKETEMLPIVKEKGINFVYAALREFEENDASSLRMPRFKQNDDSSCLYLKLKK